MHYLPVLLNVAALIYGGITDFRKREIPNLVPLVLLAAGLISFSGVASLMGLIIPAVLMLTAAGITKSEVPGGDFKLLCGLGFAAGIWELAVTLGTAGVLSVLYGAVRKLPMKRNVPLCSYVAIAYVVVKVTMYALQITFAI